MTPILRSSLVFLTHQFVGTLGTAFLASFAFVSTAEVIQTLRPATSMHWAYWILTGTPYYPVQILSAFYLGWRVSGRLPHRMASYVWVLPLVLLAYAFAMGTSLTPGYSVLTQPGIGPSRVSYYFGWGCKTSLHCLDRLLLTLPFYISVSYSLAAAIRGSKASSRDSRVLERGIALRDASPTVDRSA